MHHVGRSRSALIVSAAVVLGAVLGWAAGWTADTAGVPRRPAVALALLLLLAIAVRAAVRRALPNRHRKGPVGTAARAR